MAVMLDVAPGQVPFTVTAELRGGASWERPYGLDLAGILAAHQRRLAAQTLADTGALVSTPLPDTAGEIVADMNLPLARCTTAGAAWHWAASCAIAVAASEDPEPRTFYRVVDLSWAGRAADRPLPYMTHKVGPYRDVMMAAPVVMCTAVQWRGVGDIEKVRAAVRPLRFIGRRRATGEGRVLRWDVHEETPVDVERWLHVQDGEVLRPVPPACLDTLGVPYRMGSYALRPPSWHPDRLMDLAMTAEPDDGDSWFD